MATRRNQTTPTGTTLGTVANTGGLGDLTGWKTKTVPLEEFTGSEYQGFGGHLGSLGLFDPYATLRGTGYGAEGTGIVDSYAHVPVVNQAIQSGAKPEDYLKLDPRYGEGIQYDPKTGQVTYKYDDSGSSFGGLAQEFFTNPGTLMLLTAGAGNLAGAGFLGSGLQSMFPGMTGAGELAGLEGATNLAGGIGADALGAVGANAADLTALGELGMNTDLLAPGVLEGITPGSLSDVSIPRGLPDLNTPPTNMPRDGGETAADLTQYGNAGDLAIPKGVEPGMWSRVIAGSGTIDDFAKIFGGIAPAVMGWFASNKNTEALENFTNQWMSMGQGYRDQLANLDTQGGMEAWTNGPQVQTTLNKTLEGAARALSVEGNPALNPFAQNTMRDAGLDKMWEMLTGEKQFLAGAGGLGSFNAAAPQMALAQINSGNNAWNAIGSGLSSVLNPQPTLEEVLAMLGQYRSGGQTIA